MSKLANIAFEISQDIYALSSDVDKATQQFNSLEINSEIYANKLYVYSCKASYLQQVIETVKTLDYHFKNYEKEMLLMESVIEIIDENFKISNMGALTLNDLRGLAELIKKYEKLVRVDELNNELDV